MRSDRRWDRPGLFPTHAPHARPYLKMTDRLHPGTHLTLEVPAVAEEQGGNTGGQCCQWTEELTESISDLLIVTA